MDEYMIVDIGTSSVRAAVLGTDMQIRDMAVEKRNADVCFDADEEWNRVRRLMKKVIHRGIKSVAVSSLLGWVGTDKDGRAVTPCYSYMHQEKEAYDEFVERYGKDRFYSISGRAADAEWAAFKLFAMKEKEPEMYSRMDKLLSFKDYINLKLTGVAAMDHTTAAYTYLYDIKEGRWSSEMLGTFGITESFFPKLRKPFEKIGYMKAELCEELAGSVMHIPVIAGSTDGSTAVLGAGGLECGMSVNVMGTTGVFFSVSDSVENISSCGLITNPHVIPGKWLVGGPMGMFGGTIGWLTESIGGRQFSLDDLTERAKEIRPGSDGVIVYPCLAGERAPFWNPEMTGTILGLKNKHGLVHVFRGIMEAEGYGVKNMIEKAAGMKIPCHTIRVIGGGAKNELWMQIKADITGVPVERGEDTEATLNGGLFLCMLGEGKEVRNLPGIMESDRAYPDVKHTEEYEWLYKKYIGIHGQIEKIYKNVL